MAAPGSPRNSVADSSPGPPAKPAVPRPGSLAERALAAEKDGAKLREQQQRLQALAEDNQQLAAEMCAAPGGPAPGEAGTSHLPEERRQLLRIWMIIAARSVFP